MKTAFLKNAFLLPLTIVALSFGLTSCDKDDELSQEELQALAGLWDITSYSIDGDEYIGFLAESGTIEFDPDGLSGGEFTQSIKFFDEEEPAYISGEYTVNARKGEIRLEYDGVVVTANIEIDGDELDWKGRQDGFPLDVAATKRP
jgi:hypothetical protein